MAQWYNPRTGESTAIGACENSGIRVFEPPGAEAYGNDWVLVFDNPKFLNSKTLQLIQTAWTEEQPRPIRWTDDFSNLLKVVDW
jgi:hypothetical protein